MTFWESGHGIPPFLRSGRVTAVLRQEALRVLFEDDDGRQSFHARLLQGATRWETRRSLQAAFNRPGASPRVLIAQSQVGREGLNLHESCRVVVQFQAEWNPAVLEQQIGRVDRKGSLWEQRVQKWLSHGAQGEPPFVEVRQLIFEGTYDAFQWDRVMRRQHVFDDLAHVGRRVAGPIELARRHRVDRVKPGKQPDLRARDAPPVAQKLQQLWREHRVTILAALSALDTEHHARAVDVRHL